MEKVLEIHLLNSSQQRISHATSQQDPKTKATSKEQTLKYRTSSEIHTNCNSNTTKRHNENFGQPQKQRQEQTPSQQQYYMQNAATTTTIHEHQQQPQLTPTIDYFRFSALYALVATSTTTAAYSMRDACACVTAYDEVHGDGEGDDDNNDNDYTPRYHSTRQRCMPATTVSELKRSRSSLTQPQLSKLLRATCLRNCETDTDVGVDAGAQGVSGCGFFGAIATSTGGGTSLVGGGASLDTRSLFYLTLVFFIYCGVMLRASVAATAIANATTLNNSSDSHENNVPPICSAPAVDVTNESVVLIDKSTRNFIAVTTPTPSTISVHAPSASPRSVAVDLTAAILSSSRNVSALAATNAAARAFEVGAHERLTKMQRVVKRDTAHVPDDDDDSAYHDDEFDEYEALINNRSAKGKYIGAPCFSNMTCETSLIHVNCDKETKTCGCVKNYPVQLGLTKGCAKPKKLGEQCFYDETCMYSDENSLCVQVRHNAMCQCVHGFHSVSHTKPTRRVFCTKDLKELSSDLPTLLGVSTGIAVLAGLICMVLHLFSKTKYPRPRNFGDANLPPPIMYSSEAGIPLTVQSGRPSSRSSLRSSGSIGSYGNRRASSGGATIGGQGVSMSGGGGGGCISSGTKGILVSTSRTGAARSAAILLISCHLTELAKEATLRTTTSRHTSGAGCSANSRDNLDENGSGGGTTAGTTGGSGSRSCDSTLSMTRHLQKQLNHQRHLLSLELSPAKTKNNDRIRTLLGINGIDNYRTDDDDELNSLDHNHLQIGALPTPASETPRFARFSGKSIKLVSSKRENSTQLTSTEKLVPSSRRPSLASVHSTSSSVRSYSMMRFEKEAQQKEIRQEMKLRLARLHQQQHLNQNKPQIVIGDTLQHYMGAASTLSRLSGMPTPSPLTPNSTDELLPAVDELQEYPPKSEDLATTINKMAGESVATSTLAAIKQAAVGTSVALPTTMAASASASGSGGLVTPGTPSDTAGAAGYIGPYSSSTEAL